MRLMYIKIISALFILMLLTPYFAMANRCEVLISCISINGETAVKELERNLKVAGVPFWMVKDALFTNFMWLKKYDSIVEVLKKKSYEKSILGDAKLLIDIGKYKKGINLIKQEASKGNSDAYVILGLEYRRGRALPIDYKKSYNYYKMAKDKNNPDGYFYLGRCYEMGIGVNKDCSKAVQLFKEGKKRGSRLAIYRLIEYYRNGRCGIQKDAKKAENLKKELTGHQ